jgi:hypothetical protein
MANKVEIVSRPVLIRLSLLGQHFVKELLYRIS